MTCSCGRTAPINCPRHGDSAEDEAQELFDRMTDTLGARPGGPLRLVVDSELPHTAPNPPSGEA